MGIRTVMITGDNPLTAAAIAAESGVDDFLAQATPEAKLTLIRKHQAGGHLVAMCGDGTNDAPALAQADVAVAMNSGTQAAKEAGNMVDLDSNPTKLIEVVETGKQMLMTRGEVFRDYSRRGRHDIPGLGHAERHAFGDARERDSLGRDFQCLDHRRLDSPGFTRREVPAHWRRGPAAQ